MDGDERDRWREELIRRQRNIVFPDTVRNEGNFLRGIVQNRARLNPVQRIGAGVFGLMFLSGASFFAATAIREVLEERSLLSTGAWAVSSLVSLLYFAVAFKLVFVGVFPGRPDNQDED